MQVFWGNILESDISAFAGTLILPDYMSHLQLVPFRFSDQPKNRNGDESLVLTYTAPGRIEEFELEPEKTALDLLCYSCPRLQRDRIRLLETGAIWNWQMARSFFDFPVQTDSEKKGSDKPTMKIFFKPEENLPEIKSQFSFPAEKAYWSVSRKELFLHRDVMIAYFCFRILSLGFSILPEDVTFDATSYGIKCSTPTISWEWGLESDGIFQELIQFSNLKSWIPQLESHVTPVFNAPETVVNENGIKILLSNSVETK